MASETDTAVESDTATSEPSTTASSESGGRATDKRDLERLLSRTFGIDVEEVLPEDVQRVLEDFEDQLEDMQNSEGVRQARTVIGRARLLFQMLGAWAEGRFALPWRSAAAITGGLAYLVNPMGILPSFLKGDDSLLDDALVVFLCYKLVEKDLKRFVDEEDLDPEEYGFAS